MIERMTRLFLSLGMAVLLTACEDFEIVIEPYEPAEQAAEGPAATARSGAGGVVEAGQLAPPAAEAAPRKPGIDPGTGRFLAQRVATELNNLAEAYRLQGRYAEAEPLYKHSLAIREKALGPEHPRVATTLNNLAVLYQAQARYAEAEPLYKRSLGILEKTLGSGHPQLAQSLLGNYAALLRKTNRAAEAAKMEARAKRIRSKQ